MRTQTAKEGFKFVNELQHIVADSVSSNNFKNWEEIPEKKATDLEKQWEENIIKQEVV